jgi:hypothetical protein
MTSEFEGVPATHENRPVYISYIFLAATLVLVGWGHLATPLLTVLFCYFVLKKLHFTRSKATALVLFFAVLVVSFYGFVVFVKNALHGLPEIAEKSIPRVLAFAQENSIELPFEDVESLKALAMDTVRHQVRYLGNFAKLATKEFVFLLIGIVVACSLFLNPAMDLEKGRHRVHNNLYSLSCDQIVLRLLLRSSTRRSQPSLRLRCICLTRRL